MWLVGPLPFVLAAGLLAGCMGNSSGSGKEQAVPKEEKHDPVTLRFYTGDKDYEQRFKAEIADKVKQKYPYISFEFQGADTGKQIQDLVVAGESPDIYYQGTSALDNQLIKFDLQYDMADLIKKDNFDLSRLDPSYLDIIKNASGTFGGTYFGLPVVAFTTVLYYNKDLFDKFGVSYPKDGMTWDDAYNLATRLTRYEDGVQYRGMTMNFTYLLDNNQLGADYFDPKADRAAVNSDQWKSIFTTLSRFYKLPMNAKLDKRSRVKEVQAFTGDRISAMHADVTGAIDNFPDDFTNWDMVSMPTMKEAPGINFQANPRFYYIMNSSKHKDDAFKVVDFVLSDDMQMAASKAGKATVLNNPAIRKVYGQDYAKLKGKHIEALYVSKPVKPSPPRDSKLVTVPVAPHQNDEFNNVLLGLKDVNTALRDFEESLNKSIAAEKAK
ncbi:MAG: hypothetical protein K0R75_1436 [Paenibacillaceae bacterium]|jgi:multiple sugar transport system substrate-binding protein|nr:hypothetical protein [Paenibacillaceae bacterium]